MLRKSGEQSVYYAPRNREAYHPATSLFFRHSPSCPRRRESRAEISFLKPAPPTFNRPAAALNAAHEHGASLVEFVIVIPIILGLTLAMIQAGFVMMGKSLLNYATFEAARAGALEHAKLEPIQKGLARGLIPLYGGGKTSSAILTSFIKAQADLSTHATIQILSPTQEAFADYAITENNIRQIPNDNLSFRPASVSSNSGVNIQDANLLKIRVIYGYKPFTIARPFLAVLSTLNPEHSAYYQAGRIPIVAHAVVRMQSPAYEHAAYRSNPGANQDDPGTTGSPGGPGQPEPGPSGGGGGGGAEPLPGPPGEPCGRSGGTQPGAGSGGSTGNGPGNPPQLGEGSACPGGGNFCPVCSEG